MTPAHPTCRGRVAVTEILTTVCHWLLPAFFRFIENVAVRDRIPVSTGEGIHLGRADNHTNLRESRAADLD